MKIIERVICFSNNVSAAESRVQIQRRVKQTGGGTTSVERNEGLIIYRTAINCQLPMAGLQDEFAFDLVQVKVAV